MTDIRAIRLSRGLTLIDLALLTEIPARRLAELEYGMQRLDPESRARLAHVFHLPPELLHNAMRRETPRDRATIWMKRGAYMVIAVMIGMLFPVIPILNSQPSASAAPHLIAPERAATAAATPTDRQTRAIVSATARPQPSATALPAPTAPPPTSLPPTPTPRFTLAADGPHGCPLTAPNGHVVVTQGYNEGTHMPTSVWGAVDLAIDGGGDGNAEPATTEGAPIAATTDGVAHVYLGSWPGGNYVRITDEQTGWSTAYAHLDSVEVTDGQIIGAGALIGTVGSTGMASGPHLHYEVWHGGANVDPTGLIECH